MLSVLPQALLIVAFGLVDRYMSRRREEHFQQLIKESQEHYQQMIKESQEHYQQMIKESQEHYQQLLVILLFSFLACFSFLAWYVRRQVIRQDKKHDLDRLELRRKHDLDRLELGIYFATIWDVWTKNPMHKDDQEVQDLAAQVQNTTRSSNVYGSLRDTYAAAVDTGGAGLQFLNPLDDQELNNKTKMRSGRLESIFGGPDKSLAHIFPASWVCSWFYGFVAERLVLGLPTDGAHDRAMLRYLLVHDQENGLKYSSRNLLPLPKDHDDYFDKCTKDCLLIIPIMDADSMASWHGEAYDVLVVASSAEVYQWMKLGDHFLEQESASPQEISKAAAVLKAAVADLLHSLVVRDDGPIADGETLFLEYQKNKGGTPTTAIGTVSFASTSADSAETGRSGSTGNSEGKVVNHLQGKIKKLRRTKSKIEEKGFPMPKQLEDIRKPLLKVSLKCLVESSSVPDPQALMTKAGINYSAFATDGDMKLLTGCRVSPPTVEGDFDSPDTVVAEETLLPTFIDVPTIQEFARPTPKAATDRSSSLPHVVSSEPVIRAGGTEANF